MKLAATVTYADDISAVVHFYRQAFGLEPRIVDDDVQLPGREPDGVYQFAILDCGGSELHIASHALGSLLMPGYVRPHDGAAGVEIVFYTDDVAGCFRRATGAGATPVSAPREMPWGQTVAYVRGLDGVFIGLCSPPPA